MKLIHEDHTLRVVVDTDFEAGVLILVHDKTLKRSHPLALPEAMAIPDNFIKPLADLLLKASELIE